ncbi:MAG: histidine triad nucleotide-binding protein [Thermoanaerobaculia bacterium]
MDPACVFCRIAAGEIPAPVVYQDDDVVAFRDLHPQAPVHVLVIPRRHLPTLVSEGGDQADLLGTLLASAVRVARMEGLDAQGFRLVVNCLEAAGQSVFHLHVHLLGGRPMGWPPG